jgi:hypothetical protein
MLVLGYLRFHDTEWRGENMNSINVQEILKLLALGEGQNALWSIFLYLIFFLALITMFLIPDKNMVPTLMTATVLLFAIVAKVSLASARPILKKEEFGMMVINILMGVFPFIVAGMIRSGKQKSKAQGPAIINGLFGLTYFFLFWVVVQRCSGGGC